MKRSIRTLLPLSAVTLSLTFASTGGAAASVPAQMTAEKATAAADVDLVTTLDAATRAEIEESLKATEQPALPADAVAFGFNRAGDAVAVNSEGAETVLESAASMDAQITAQGSTATSVSPKSTASGETSSKDSEEGKGVLTGAAATIAGCGGGVIGFDAIMSILEKRVSYWALVKFVGGKIGPGLAISCIAGAGGALATYMNW